MNRLAHWMMRLYPSRWRARYGDELHELLSDTGADARVVTDLFRGGMRMQLKTWPFLKLAIALGIAGMLLGAGLGILLPSEYTSRATLQITPAVISENAMETSMANSLNEHIQWMETHVLSRGTLSGIINDPQLHLYPAELSDKPLEDVVEEMKDNIHVDFVALPGGLGKRATAFNIEFTHSDPIKAQQTVRALIGSFMEENQKSQRTQPPNSSSWIVVGAPANLPASPFYPRKSTVLLAGFILGVLVASIWRLIQRTGFVARRFAPIALAFGIAGLGAVIVINYLDIFPYQYRSTAILHIHGGATSEISALKDRIVSRTTLSTVIQDPHLRLYKAQVETLPLEDVVQSMKTHLHIDQSGDLDGALIRVSFDYRDRFKAQQVLTTIVNRVVEESYRPDLLAESRAVPIPEVMDVLDTASLPVNPTSPKRYLMTFGGGIYGVIIAAIIALIRRRWRPEPSFPVGAVPE